MQTQDRQFTGLDNPLRFEDPDVVLPLVEPILAGWPNRAACGDGTPFACLGPIGDGKAWRLTAPRAVKPEAIHDPVNAICDLIVEMSWERLRSRPDLLCLHAAAVAFGNHLVIFPNQRRAGKSLLSATLAHRGHAIYTDDFIPLAVDPATRVISGIANGIAPRLRLPLPDTLSPDLAAWINAHITVRNKQYGYLTKVDPPRSGSELPVGAIVMLDRDMEMEGPATLTPVSINEALAAVVTQNFGRQVHAGAILAITEAMATTVPVLRLTYRDVEEAAALLESSPHLTDLPEAVITAEGKLMPDRPAPLDQPVKGPEGRFDPDLTYKRTVGVTEVVTDQAIFVADAEGLAIHHLNASMSLIWTLLEEPASVGQMTKIMHELYPEVPFDQLQADAERAVQFLWGQRLVAAHSS